MQKQSLLLLAIVLSVCSAAWAQNQTPSSQLIPVSGPENTLTKASLFQKYYHLQKSDALRTLRTEQDALGFQNLGVADGEDFGDNGRSDKVVMAKFE